MRSAATEFLRVVQAAAPGAAAGAVQDMQVPQRDAVLRALWSLAPDLASVLDMSAGHSRTTTDKVRKDNPCPQPSGQTQCRRSHGQLTEVASRYSQGLPATCHEPKDKGTAHAVQQQAIQSDAVGMHWEVRNGHSPGQTCPNDVKSGEIGGSGKDCCPEDSWASREPAGMVGQATTPSASQGRDNIDLTHNTRAQADPGTGQHVFYKPHVVAAKDRMLEGKSTIALGPAAPLSAPLTPDIKAGGPSPAPSTPPLTPLLVEPSLHNADEAAAHVQAAAEQCSIALNHAKEQSSGAVSMPERCLTESTELTQGEIRSPTSRPWQVGRQHKIAVNARSIT